MKIKLGERYYDNYSKFGIEEIGNHLEELYEKIEALEATIKSNCKKDEKKTVRSSKRKQPKLQGSIPDREGEAVLGDDDGEGGNDVAE